MARIPEHASDATRRLNPDVWPCDAVVQARAESEPTRRAPGTPRPLDERLTKAERRWMSDIATQAAPYRDAPLILPQVTLRFWDGTSYTIDFLVVWLDRAPTCVEVKGGYRGPGWEQGYERYRRARDAWTAFAWELWELREGAWRCERVASNTRRVGQ